ncbi:hypothetical protein RYX36_033741 [Vicia faba]
MEVEQPLKLFLIPYPAPGHMIPLYDIATLFASCGHHITIITTPSNVHFFTKSFSSPDPLFFRIHTVEFPAGKVGLPHGVEYLSSTTDPATSGKIYTGAMLLHGPVEDFMANDPPDCIIADCIYPWLNDLANKFQIPTLAFTGFSLFTISLMESLRKNHIVLPDTDSDSDSDSSSFTVTNFPHPITLCTKPPKIFTASMETMLENMLKSNGLIVNSFAELDGEECIEHYQKTTGHKAWHLVQLLLFAEPFTREPREETRVL